MNHEVNDPKNSKNAWCSCLQSIPTATRPYAHKYTLWTLNRGFLFIAHFGWQSFCLLNALRNLPVAQRPGSQQKNKGLLERYWRFLKKQRNWTWNASVVSCFPPKVSGFWSLPGPLYIRRYRPLVLVDIKRKVGIRSKTKGGLERKDYHYQTYYHNSSKLGLFSHFCILVHCGRFVL